MVMLTGFRPFRTDFSPDDAGLVQSMLAETGLTQDRLAALRADASGLVTAIRKESGGFGVESFLQEYSLSTREGLALMVLAEALLRVPDHLTADQLIEDKLAAGHFDQHLSHSGDLMLSAAAWGLGLSVRILKPGETPQTILGDLAKRIGLPAVRLAARQAMKLMGHQFVLGETIEAALDRAKAMEAKGYLHSYDMLGEGAAHRQMRIAISSPIQVPFPPLASGRAVNCPYGPASRSSSRPCIRVMRLCSNSG